VSDRFAVTFDDGPNPRATGRLLDVLAHYGARATFFMLGHAVRRYPALVRRVVAEGHEAAVHGDHHAPLAFQPPWAIRNGIRRCAASIEAASGARARFYRPPFGFMMPGQAHYVRACGYESVLGDVYPEDPQSPGTERILSRVLPRLRGGSILILHDGSPVGPADRGQTIEALDGILSAMESRGLTATSVGALLLPTRLGELAAPATG
jgi:peptidoglycan/xylan/chitin deacetylase (PgdA/CDA1 family)